MGVDPTVFCGDEEEDAVMPVARRDEDDEPREPVHPAELVYTGDLDD